MARLRWLTVVALSLVGAAGAHAQLLIYANPYDHGTFGYARVYGFGHHHHRHGIRVYGPGLFLPPGPYGVTSISSSVNVIVPPPVVVNVFPRVREPDEFDTTGIDLDEYDPRTMRRRREPPERRVEPPPPKPKPPAPKPQPPQRPAPPPVPMEKPFPREEPEKDLSLIELGRRAFAQKEYGLAAQRFRQAVEADPKDALGHFLLAQAQFALGKYLDAVSSIQSGMDLRKDWPRAAFSARALYRGNDLDFLGHLKRLEEVVDNHPKDRFLLFLLAYELWFDGKRAKAVPLFEQAKKLSRRPVYIDPFLAAAAPGPVAAK